jgi:hypothetical protein
MRHRLSIKTKTLMSLGLAGVFALLACCSLAFAAETTRSEYVAVVEPICKANTNANERILHNVKREVIQGKLKPAAAALAKASKALDATYAQLRAVPQPAADTSTLTKWLGEVKHGAALFAETAGALRVGNKAKASKDESKLTHNAVLANDTVMFFEFHYCHFEPSRFIR